jgi:nitrogen fixation NifU-like protein
VYLKLDETGRVEDVAFQGAGCAISTASASLMTESVKGKRIDEVEQVFQKFHDLVTNSDNTIVDAEELGKLAVFSGIRDYPMRVKCATLSWHTLRAALHDQPETAKTE